MTHDRKTEKQFKNLLNRIINRTFLQRESTISIVCLLSFWTKLSISDRATLRQSLPMLLD